jgi:hypothetical protein
MFSANVKIIEEVKGFVTLVASDRELLNNFSVCDKHFTRTRKLPFERLVLLIGHLCKKTLSVELETFSLSRRAAQVAVRSVPLPSSV